LVVSKSSIFYQTDKVYEKFVYRSGHIYFEGSLVNYYGRQGKISSRYRDNREKRDGYEYHITIIHNSQLELMKQRPEFKDMKEDQFISKVLQAFQQVEDNWTDLGLGTAKDKSNQAWYRIVQWDSANKVRESLGLSSTDLHITVGFSGSDVHNVKKDISTLVKDSPSHGHHSSHRSKSPRDSSRTISSIPKTASTTGT